MRLLELSARLFEVRAVTALQPERIGPVDRATWIRRTICVAVLTALIGSGAPYVRRSLAGPFPDRIDAFHSTNVYLEAITESGHVSERIIDVMAALPPDKPLLIFERDKDAGSSMLGMALAYLAWPREVRFETANDGHCDEQLAKIRPGSVSGVAFCDLPAPSWVPGGLRLGKTGKLIAFEAPGKK